MNEPKLLQEIRDYLIKNNFSLSKRFKDGRINASINEDEILNQIKKKFPIQIPKSRYWYDFAIEDKNVFYPVNIKVTNTTQADNLNCKLGIYYALTGNFPDFPNEISWLDYFVKLRKDLKKNDSDYYFLVINKMNLKDIFLNSLKSLSKLQPNGNNLPFQCNWDANRKYKNREFKDSVNFLLKTFGKSIKLRAEVYFIFKKLFGEYV